MALLPEFLELTFSDGPKNGYTHSRILPFANGILYESQIKSYKLLTVGPDVKRVYDLEISLEGVDKDFSPGDAIGILPRNEEKEVDLLLNRLQLNEVADKTYFLNVLKDTLKKKPVIPPHIPISGTLRDLFLNYVDIRSAPKKIFLQMLMQYTNNKEERAVLEALSHPKSVTYTDFIKNVDEVSLFNMLNKFQSCTPPISRLMEHLPALLPRYYSIKSSRKSPNLHVAFSVIELGPRRGVCSGYLEDLCLGETKTGRKTAQFYFRKPTAFLRGIPNDCPVILIGPGTGVAPFLGFLHDRPSKSKKMCTLFYGCRYENRDFLYKDEVYGYLQSGALSSINVAYSRDEGVAKRMYVQDKILENGSWIAKAILEECCYVCVCGDAKNLLKNVEEAIVQVLVENGHLSWEKSKEILAELKKNNRYQLDIWT